MTPQDLTDAQLEAVMLSLQLACGRSHSQLKRKRELWYCFAFRVFQTEAQLRGLPTPQPPYHTGDLPPFSE